ncbi:urha1 [Scardovia inopinata]|uniref:Inosine/uridine-preferring nucleoside hydrolase domain-containing protein n=1 Tax=Scardovia inopinata F0304 TaxID=641146 RepID=W5III3_SCAIO|nr:nucleoside hydrolase [Scardovia inopinata]EFG26797.1 hypothetical protein HMPREF9020_00425 [Scardovia inopinata F0304]BAR06400.1 putative nucleoside hydrolase [Scardovia inopinata JCM 12537]SUV51916.1 urha1 [Scardovia inopinata]
MASIFLDTTASPAGSVSSGAKKTRIFLDCDTGIDDALAILFLLASPQADLIGLAGIFGNVQADQAVRNSRQLLDFLGRQDIPVYQGASQPSFWNDDPARSGRPYSVNPGCTRFHGDNGLGGAVLPVSSSADINQKVTGAEAIAQAVRRYGKEVTILATGPLTDVDLALQSDPSLASDMKLVLMGGTLTQPGNCYDLVCETNIINDPEAANRVFHSGADITMVGLDVTYQCLMTRSQMNAIKALDTSLAQFVYEMTDYYISANEASDPIFAQGSPLHDPLAAAVALDPSLIRTFPINLRVEIQTGDGYGVRGRTIGDPTMLGAFFSQSADVPTHSPRTRVALGVDSRRFVDLWYSRLKFICSRDYPQTDHRA